VKRVVGVILLLLIAAPLAAIYWYTRPAQVIPIVEDTLAAMTGCEVTVGNARINRHGEVLLENLVFSLPDEQGEYGVLATVDKVEMTGDPMGFLDGSYQPQRIVVTGMTQFLVEDTATGHLNLEQLVLPEGEQSGAPLEIPSITLNDSEIRFAQRTPTGIVLLSTMPLHGELAVDPANASAYSFRLNERLASETEQVGASVSGAFDLDSLALTMSLNNFSFADEQRYFLPATYRPVWDRLAPSGKLPRLTVEASPGEDRRLRLDRAELELAGVGLNLDILDTTDPDIVEVAAFLNAIETRLIDVHGLLVVEDGLFRIEDAVGRIAQTGLGMSTITYRISGHGGLALDEKFEVHLTTDPFRLGEHNQFFLAWSPLTGEAYRRFRPSGSLAVTADFYSDGSGDPPDWHIGLDLIDATITHAFFPMTISQLRGQIDITQQRIAINNLRGTMPNGGDIHIEGSAAPASDIAAVELAITISDLPIDDALLGALKPGERENLARFLNQTAYDELVAKGMISAEAGGDAPQFTMGGRVDVFVPVHRPYGEDVDYSIVPVLELAGVGAVMADFPYPVVVESGSVEVGPDFVNIRELVVTGITGGGLTIDGDAKKDADLGEYLPSLSISQAVLPIDPLLLNAVGGEAQVLLEDLGVTGMLRVAGPVFQKPGEEIDMALDVLVDEGAMVPRDGDLRFRQLMGSFTLRGKSIEDLDLACLWGDAPLLVSGIVDWAGGVDQTSAELTFDATAFSFDPTLLEVLPPQSETRDRLVELFDQYKPEGTYDAQLVWRPVSADDAPDDYALHLALHTLSMDLLGGRLVFDEVTGNAHVTPAGLAFDALRGTFTQTDSGGPGWVEATGMIGFEGPTDIRFDLTASSEGIGNNVRVLVPDAAVAVLDAISFAGDFSMPKARLEIDDAGGENQRTRFSADLDIPNASMKLAGMEVNDAQFAMTFAVDDDGVDDVPAMRFTLDAPALTVMDRRITRLSGTADNSARRDLLRTSQIVGSMYGGAVTLEAALGMGGLDQASFEAELLDVAFPSFIEPESAPEEDASAAVAARGTETGRLSASLSLTTGYAPGSERHGRGMMRLSDARLFDENPIGMSIVEAMNLTLPSGGGFDKAAVDFLVVDDLVMLDRIVMETPEHILTGRGLRLAGRGTMAYPGFELDLRLRTEITGTGSDLPFAELIRRARNELVGIEVTGTLNEPNVNYNVLQGTRDVWQQWNELLRGRAR